jgi:hypothetical protein
MKGLMFSSSIDSPFETINLGLVAPFSYTFIVRGGISVTVGFETTHSTQNSSANPQSLPGGDQS